jgi:hypothetical protein
MSDKPLTDEEMANLEAQESALSPDTGSKNDAAVLSDEEMAKLEADGHAVNPSSILSKTGDFIKGTASQTYNKVKAMPGQLYDLGKNAITKTPGEIEDVLEGKKSGKDALHQFSQSAGESVLPFTIPESARTLTEKAIAKVDPTLSSEDYQTLYGDRSTDDISNANKQKAAEIAKEFPGMAATGTLTGGAAVAAATGGLKTLGQAATFGIIGAGQAGTKELEESGDISKAGQAAISSGLVGAGTTAAASLGAKALGGKLNAAPEAEAAANAATEAEGAVEGAVKDSTAGLADPEVVTAETDVPGALMESDRPNLSEIYSNPEADLTNQSPLAIKARTAAGNAWARQAGLRGTSFSSPAEFSRIGREVKALNILSYDAEATARNANSVMTKTGTELGNQLQAHDTVVNALKTDTTFNNPSQVNELSASEAAKQAALHSEELIRKLRSDPVTQKAIQKEVSTLSALAQDADLSMVELSNMKARIGREAYKAAANKETDLQMALSDLERNMNSQIEHSLSSLDEMKPELAQSQDLPDNVKQAMDQVNFKNFMKAKTDYGIAKMTHDASLRQAMKDSSSAVIQPNDVISGWVALYQSGNPLTAGMVVGSKMALRKGGNLLLGNIEDKAANGVNSLSQKVGKATNTVTSAAKNVGLTELLNTRPEAFGKYAGVLQNAASRGPASLAATHFILSQTDPDYRNSEANKQINNHSQDDH